jgi:hypothetical protein
MSSTQTTIRISRGGSKIIPLQNRSLKNARSPSLPEPTSRMRRFCLNRAVRLAHLVNRHAWTTHHLPVSGVGLGARNRLLVKVAYNNLPLCDSNLRLSQEMQSPVYQSLRWKSNLPKRMLALPDGKGPFPPHLPNHLQAKVSTCSIQLQLLGPPQDPRHRHQQPSTRGLHLRLNLHLRGLKLPLESSLRSHRKRLPLYTLTEQRQQKHTREATMLWPMNPSQAHSQDYPTNILSL